MIKARSEGYNGMVTGMAELMFEELKRIISYDSNKPSEK
jgi:hypothetical protein